MQEDVHQGGLARPVFAHKGENLPLADIKGNVVVGKHAGKFHAYVLELYCKFLQGDPSQSNVK